MNDPDELVSTWRAYLTALNSREMDQLPRFFHDPVQFNGKSVTLAEYTAAIQENLDAVPDFQWEIEDLTSSEDTILARLTDTGTPTSTWLGNPPTGNTFTATEFAAYHFRNGKIAAMWFLLDLSAISDQLTAGKDA